MTFFLFLCYIFYNLLLTRGDKVGIVIIIYKKKKIQLWLKRTNHRTSRPKWTDNSFILCEVRKVFYAVRGHYLTLSSSHFDSNLIVTHGKPFRECKYFVTSGTLQPSTGTPLIETTLSSRDMRPHFSAANCVPLARRMKSVEENC